MALRIPRMAWPVGINLFGFAILVIGILLLIWSPARGSVSVFGVALLIAGFVIQIVSSFLD
jgi:hypothetical protein